MIGLLSTKKSPNRDLNGSGSCASSRSSSAERAVQPVATTKTTWAPNSATALAACSPTRSAGKPRLTFTAPINTCPTSKKKALVAAVKITG